MSAVRRVAALAVDAACGVAGRRGIVRAARFALHRARLDLPNDPAVNGEYALQRWLFDAVPPAEPVTVLDVGANIGAWSRALLTHARRAGRLDDLRLHAFEPAAATHRHLVATLPAIVRVNRLAMSDTVGSATLHVGAPEAGSHSLYDGSATGASAHLEVVDTTTVDRYVADQGIHRIDLVKIDTEGHDFRVLRGAEQCLRAQRVSLVQFEYNHRWVYARHFLKDVFDLLVPLGYRIGKVTPRGVETYPGWDPELETFVEGNFVAGTPEVAAELPGIAWWKSQ